MARQPEIILTVQHAPPTQQQLDELRAALRPRNCGNCAHWSTRDAVSGVCVRLTNSSPADDVFVDTHDTETRVRTVAAFSCGLWERAGQTEPATAAGKVA